MSVHAPNIYQIKIITHIKYHYPFVTYNLVEVQICRLDAHTTQLQFQSHYNCLNCYKINNITINVGFKYMNLRT